jgi:hypothetical protein
MDAPSLKTQIVANEARFRNPVYVWTNEIEEPPKELENVARKLILQNARQRLPDCQVIDLLRVFGDQPAIPESVRGYRLLHILEK